MKNPEAAAFVRDVMARVGADNPTELSKILGAPWTDRDQQRKLYKWREGLQHPNGPSTIALIRAAGLLREDSEAQPSMQPTSVDDLQTELAAWVRRLRSLLDALEAELKPVRQVRKRPAR